MRQRRAPPEFSLSFLDVICCGFGAVILLLMITKTVQPQVIEQALVNAEGAVADLTEQLFEIRGETTILNRDLAVKREQVSEYEARIAILQGALARTRSEYDALNTSQNANAIVREQLAIARQKLSEEEQRLLGKKAETVNDLIGGIPVDSEFVILVVDTSGSMRVAWDRLMSEIESIFSIYPDLKGIQALDASGNYILPGVPGQFFNDSYNTRLQMQRALESAPSSVSDPVPGIRRAIKDFWRDDRKISIYYMGDDYTVQNKLGPLPWPGGGGLSRPIQTILEEIDAINARDDSGQRKVTIHAIGFPVLYQSDFRMYPQFIQSRQRFATLMRLMTSRNGGVFVGINSIF